MTSVQTLPLTGRTVLITGASSGLGAHFATVTAAAGAQVVLAARRMENLQKLADSLGADRAFPVAMDVSDPASVVAAFDAAESKFGLVNSIVCNAGVGLGGPAIGMQAADIFRTLSVNVAGAYLAAREGAKRLIAAGEKASPEKAVNGRIVMIASIAGTTPLADLSAYCASKAAVMMLAKCFAGEWVRHGINVNAICPGYIETELNAGWFASTRGKRQIDSFPRKKLAAAEDLDPILLHLLSDASRAITGAAFTIDDGQSL